MARTIHVDRERCIGSGNCVFWAPNTFELDDAGKSTVVDQHGDDDEAVANAVEGCPMSAISVTDDAEPLDGTGESRAGIEEPGA